LLFDCHAAKPCGHKACGECLSRFRDCPLCGADVDGTEPDAAAQGMVDAFLGAHGVYPDAVAAALDMGPLMQELLAMSGAGAAAAGQQGANGSSSDTNDNKSALTAALLQGVALRSYAGGNVSAALARFEAAREALLRVLEEEEEKEKKEASGCSSKAALALGVVLGGIGDCHRRRQGSEAAAEASYKASAERLAVVADVDLTEQQILVAADDAAASSSPVSPLILEARQALGVTLNKLGDLNYARGDIEAALNEYRRALGLRKARLGTLERSGAATPAAAAEDARLEVAAALIKAGDAATRLPAEQTHAGAYFAEARTLLRALGGGGGDGNAPPTLDRARAAKRDRLMDALEAVEKGS
jgi:tetratricopeptide (TPR) repeat protein